MSEHIFTDRYEGLMPYPDPETMCKGGCDGMGCYPTMLDDATPEEALRWQKAHDAGEGHDGGKCDGWHFIICPDCGGTGKR